MTTPPPAARRSGIPNIFRNLRWLLGGKGFAAVTSFIYLALLSRSLGLKDFGHFSLIFGTAQALVALSGFQTWQTMIRFGAQPSLEHDWAKFGRLAFLCGTIDLASAVVGCGIAAVIFYGFGDVLDINPKYTDMGFWFSCAIVFARMSTPGGIVRVLNRFDISSIVEGFVPAARLVVAGVLFFQGASVGRFLLAWAVIDLLSAALYYLAAARIAPNALRWPNFGRFRQSLNENDGLLNFVGVTFVSATLEALFKQGPLLAIGYLMGTSAAGLYRLADQLAQGIGKMSGLIGQVVFPEFAIARFAKDVAAFRKLVRQITATAGLGGIVVALLAYLFGEMLMVLIGGEQFASGAMVLLPLAIAASFELASVAYEPVLFATGRPFYSLVARSLSVLTVGVGLVMLNSDSTVAIGWLVATGQALGYMVLTLAVVFTLRHMSREAAQ